MVYISLPDISERRLVFYLAMEEYVARHINEEECFFMWQSKPTVIFGRNQLIENEVNLEYCKQHGIETYRRKSGGGCVYSDMNNIMFSYIAKDENVNMTFNKYVNLVALVLCKLGVEAKPTGRNDILIDGKKVSGNAFYHVPGRSIVHGTMLYDTDMQNMIGSITPSDAKLVSKGVKSVRQHIALLKDYISISIGDFMAFVRKNLCDREIALSHDDVKKIEEIEKEYLTTEFIFGNNPKYTKNIKGRIENVGDFDIRIELKNNEIKKINMLGDFFIVGDIDKAILSTLKGKQLDRETLVSALPEKLDDTILNLKKEDFINLLVE